MNLTLRDKNAVITGGARGIGAACAQVLAAEGAKVILIDVDQDGLAATEKKIQAQGGKVISCPVDITKRDLVKQTLNRLEEDCGNIHILVNNAARVTTMARLTNLADDLWDGDIEINLTGSFNLTKIAFESMKKDGWGRIVFISSLAGIMGGFAQSSYAASKMGLVGLARSVALEGGKHGITANVIAPGIIGTETVQRHVSKEALESVAKLTAMGRPGNPEDVANLAAFLCSEQAGYITGEVIPVAGGLDLLVLPL